MAVNPTKISYYDLEEKLAKLLSDLILIQGNYPSFEDVFKNLTVEMMTGETRTVLQDLIDAYNNDNKGLTSARLNDLENVILGIATELLVEGNFDEVFTYDPTYGNVTNHDVTGDKTISVVYNYSDAANGILSTSVHEFKNSKLQDVTVTKTYIYDGSGNIIRIETRTVITALPEEPIV